MIAMHNNYIAIIIVIENFLSDYAQLTRQYRSKFSYTIQLYFNSPKDIEIYFYEEE